MPYYIYQVQSSPHQIVKQLSLIEQHTAFRPAKIRVREMRSSTADSTNEFKIIFADTVLEAEERLQESRDSPVLMEWEK